MGVPVNHQRLLTQVIDVQLVRRAALECHQTAKVLVCKAVQVTNAEGSLGREIDNLTLAELTSFHGDINTVS